MSAIDAIEVMNELRRFIETLETELDDKHAQHELGRARDYLGTAGQKQSARARHRDIEQAATIITGIAIQTHHGRIADGVDATLSRAKRFDSATAAGETE